MTPRRTEHNTANRLAAHAILTAKPPFGSRASCILVSDGEDGCGGELCTTVRFPTGGSAFSRLINHVVRLRPQKQVRRIATRRVVAGVASEHPVRNLAVREYPRGAVSAPRPHGGEGGCAAVAEVANRPRPWPAGLGATALIHTPPEPARPADRPVPAITPVWTNQPTTLFAGKLVSHRKASLSGATPGAVHAVARHSNSPNFSMVASVAP